jgi:hypothetical protein
LSNIEEKIETVKSHFISGNLLSILWIFVGTVACWLVNPWLGWLFLAFSAFSVYIILRRFLCSSCYYCKSCTKGMAKLSILFLGANKIPGLSKSTIAGMTTFTYAVLMFIPAIVLGNSLLNSFNTMKLAALICLFSVSTIVLIGRLINRNRVLWKH